MIIQDFPNYSIFKDGTVVNNVSGKPLKPVDRRDGYKQVSLRKNKRTFIFLIHRLVAIHFINNPQHLPYVNHKDENRSNNSVDNLEWCTPSYNNTYGTRLIRVAQSQRRKIKAFKIGVLGGPLYRLGICATELNINRAYMNHAVRVSPKTVGGHTFDYDI